MTAEELVRRRVDIINAKRFGDLSEVLTPDVITHYGMQELHGVDELAATLEGFVAFPDLQTSIETIFTDGDRVGVRYLTRGTHTDEFMGVEATGRTVSFGGAGINRIIDGAIAETWTVDDLATLTRQIGVRA